MSPKGGIKPQNNIYTAMLAIVLGIVLSTAIYVGYVVYSQYGWPMQ